MCHRLSGVVTTLALVVATTAPAFAQDADREPDIDRDRVAAEQALNRSGWLRLMGTIGAGMSVAANFLSDERKTGRPGTAFAVGGFAALGLGLIGDFAQHRARTRLDGPDRLAAGNVDEPARAEAERALRQARRFGLVGDIGVAMVLATAFVPEKRLDGPVGRTVLFGAATAAGIGIVGWI